MYSLLPYGLRAMEKLEKIVDEELQAIHCSKLSMPLLLPRALWEETDRWNTVGNEVYLY